MFRLTRASFFLKNSINHYCQPMFDYVDEKWMEHGRRLFYDVLRKEGGRLIPGNKRPLQKILWEIERKVREGKIHEEALLKLLEETEKKEIKKP